jgi:hypothetical protein
MAVRDTALIRWINEYGVQHPDFFPVNYPADKKFNYFAKIRGMRKAEGKWWDVGSY